MKSKADSFNDEGCTVFGAEDDVDNKVREGPGHKDSVDLYGNHIG